MRAQSRDSGAGVGLALETLPETPGRAPPPSLSFRTVERQAIARRKAEAAEMPAGHLSGSTLKRWQSDPVRAARTPAALKRAAWRESQESAAYSGTISLVDRTRDYPHGYFVAVELGFAHEHRPSIVETMGGFKREDMEYPRNGHKPAAQSDAILSQRLTAPRKPRRQNLTGARAQKAVRAKVRAAKRAMDVVE